MRRADNLTTFMCRFVLKSGSLNLLEPSGPVQAYNEISLLLLVLRGKWSVRGFRRVKNNALNYPNFSVQKYVKDVRLKLQVKSYITHTGTTSVNGLTESTASKVELSCVTPGQFLHETALLDISTHPV